MIDKKKLILWVPIALVTIILLVALVVAAASSSDQGDPTAPRPMAPGPIGETTSPSPNVEA